MANADAVADFFANTVKALGALDIVLNNAGVGSPLVPLITIGIGAWLLTLGPAKTSQELVGPLKVDVRSQAW